MNYEIVGLCETGLKREVNQDAVFWAQEGDAAICLVADGMGGHSHGEIASNLIRQTVAGCWDLFCRNNNFRDFRTMVTLLSSELEKSNQKLFRDYCRHRMCGSTIVLLFCYQDRYAVLHAGDSRLYLKKRFSGVQLTVDEVWENQKNLPAVLRQDLQNVNRGKLVNAFGSEEELHMRMMTNELKGGELFLLCSDGLYKMCSDEQIYRAMGKARKGGEIMMHSLLDLKAKTEAAGAKDNFSIIMMRTLRRTM